MTMTLERPAEAETPVTDPAAAPEA